MLDLTNCRVTLGKGSQRGNFTLMIEDATSHTLIAEVRVPESQAANLFGQSPADCAVRLYADDAQADDVLGRESSHGTEVVPDEVIEGPLASVSRRDPRWADQWAAVQAWADNRAAELGAQSASVDSRRSGDGVQRHVVALFHFYGEPVGRAAEPEEG